MRARAHRACGRGAAALTLAGLLLASHSSNTAAQRDFRVYDSYEGYDGRSELPADYEEPGEFVVGRLMYPSAGRGFSGGGRWRQGGTSWAVDYPRGDRTFAELLDRFTRADVRSVEQPVNPEDGDDIFYWPFLMTGLAGNWDLDETHVAKLREYLRRGGFLFFDSFFGSNSWIRFEQGLNRIFPERPIVDVPADHAVFQIVYDLSELTGTQIPNMNSLMRGGGGYLGDGRVPHWRGIFDEDGRLMVLIAFNNDVADSWQWADDPRYPGERANLGLRLGVNIAVYSMSH